MTTQQAATATATPNWPAPEEILGALRELYFAVMQLNEHHKDHIAACNRARLVIRAAEGRGRS